MQNNDDIYNSPYGQDPEPPNFLRKYGLRLILIAAVVYGVMQLRCAASEPRWFMSPPRRGTTGP